MCASVPFAQSRCRIGKNAAAPPGSCRPDSAAPRPCGGSRRSCGQSGRSLAPLPKAHEATGHEHDTGDDRGAVKHGKEKLGVLAEASEDAADEWCDKGRE